MRPQALASSNRREIVMARPTGERDFTALAVSAPAFQAENSARPCSQTPAVITLELVINRHDLAPKVGHLRVVYHFVLGELRHPGLVVMRDTGVLSRPGEGVHASGPLAPREQHIRSAPQLRDPLSEIGREAHGRKLTRDSVWAESFVVARWTRHRGRFVVGVSKA
jgi:hypothetical protein